MKFILLHEILMKTAVQAKRMKSMISLTTNMNPVDQEHDNGQGQVVGHDKISDEGKWLVPTVINDTTAMEAKD